LISDGIFEYGNRDGEQFGWDRIEDFIRSHRNEPIQELKRSLCAAVETFADDVPQADDMTIVLARRNADEGFAQK
jgi:sigma-B regulation protein RsbU (phosphoserine phosphatase)